MTVTLRARLEALAFISAKLARGASYEHAVEMAVRSGIVAIGDGARAFTETRPAPRLSRKLRGGVPLVTVRVRASESTEAALSAELREEAEALKLLRLLTALLTGARDCDTRVDAKTVKATAKLERAGYGREEHSPLGVLTLRERVVFRLVTAGLSNNEVARELAISVRTVETHRARINEKLGVHSPGQLVRFAALQGLIAT